MVVWTGSIRSNGHGSLKYGPGPSGVLADPLAETRTRSPCSLGCTIVTAVSSQSTSTPVSTQRQHRARQRLIKPRTCDIKAELVVDRLADRLGDLVRRAPGTPARASRTPDAGTRPGGAGE